MNALFRLKQPVDRLLETTLVGLFFVLFACVIIQVFTRYVLNDPSIFTEETSRLAIIWLSLLGTAYACGRLEHMAYTMFPEKLKDSALLAHMRTVALVILFFAVTVMCYGGGRLVLPDPDRLRDPGHWLELMTRHHVTVWNTVPALLAMLLEHGRPLPDSLRVVMLSGDWTPLAVAAVSAGVMALFVYLAEKKHITWVENFSIAGSMLAGMAAAVLIGLV